MKKKTNYYQPTVSVSANSTRGSNLPTPNSQNYLHVLKQTSATNKTSKMITLTKPETLSSLLKAADIRPPSSNKSDSGPKISQGLSNMPSGSTYTTNLQKKILYQPINNRSVNFREKLQANSNIKAVSRNNSEPKLKKGIIDQLQSINQVALSGSFHVAENIPSSNHSSTVHACSPETKTTLIKSSPTVGIELMATATSSNDRNQELRLNSSAGFTHVDSQNSNQKSSSDIIPQKQTQPFTSDFLNESLDVDKSEEIQIRDSDVCMNHRHKKAKYYTDCEEDPLVKYKLCSKCAVALADKGAKIREIINSEEELRMSEIEAFLIKLSHSKRNTKTIAESIVLKKQDFIEFFNKQNDKAEAIRSVLEKLIKEEFDLVKKRFEIQKVKTMNVIDALENQLNGNLKEVANMQSDIERNLENILKNIEIKPFQKIIGTYHKRIQELDQNLEIIRAQKIEVEKLPGFKPRHIQELKPSIQGFFELREFQTSFLKRNEHEKEDEVEKDGFRKKANVSSLCVSFENKEKFENACSSIFEAHRIPDRFSFSASQSDGLRVFHQSENTKTFSYGGPETETSNRTLKAVYPNRGGQECFEVIYTERKAGIGNQKDETQGQNKTPSKLRYHFEGASKKPERRSSPSQYDTSPSKITTVHRGSVPSNNQNASPNKIDMNQEINSLVKRHQNTDEREEEEVDEAILGFNTGYEKDSGNNTEIEVSARYDKSFEIAPSKNYHQNEFSRRNHSNIKSEGRQVKSQNNSLSFIEDEIIFGHVTQNQHKSAYCSPNFKENIDF